MERCKTLAKQFLYTIHHVIAETAWSEGVQDKRRFNRAYNLLRDLVTCLYHKPQICTDAKALGYGIDGYEESVGFLSAYCDLRKYHPRIENHLVQDMLDLVAGIDFPPPGTTPVEEDDLDLE